MEIYLDHVRVNVSNLHQGIEWYEGTLGFKVTGHWPPENPNYAHFETGKGAIFAIMETDPSPSHGRLNFKVENVDHYWDQVADKVEILEDLFETPYGTKKFTIKDPDGNELGFVQA
ncbi:VOC family protein [Thalassobacillus hwangdonensis]|uniref:VOC family protein n=1 Tax=Thalassobacillus hwangdonensis TaxID=546108 RepID=A0ABW3L6Q1_9BACI